MTPETNIQCRLFIWRDYVSPHPLALNDEQTGFRMLKSEDHLQAEVYSWPLQYDIFAGILDEEVRNCLRKLLSRLEVSRSPDERPLAALEKFVAEAGKAIEDGNAVSRSGGLGNPMVADSPLLAFTLHLKWLIRCFKDRPGISVSIR